jgi:hypothetical protein
MIQILLRTRIKSGLDPDSNMSADPIGAEKLLVSTALKNLPNCTTLSNIKRLNLIAKITPDLETSPEIPDPIGSRSSALLESMETLHGS